MSNQNKEKTGSIDISIIPTIIKKDKEKKEEKDGK